MAIIRCQACGKPNPDFMEVCQYCDARLKPLTGDLPQPPSEPASAPEQAGIIHCQACGKPNPAFFDTCQYCDARLRPLTGDLANLAPAEDAPILADPDSGDIIRCQACGKPNPAFLEACQYCDARLKPLTAELPPERPSPEPAESWASPAPQAQPAEEVPDWLRALRGGTPDVPEAEAPTFEAEPSAQANLPDWLGGVQTSAPDQPAAPAEEVPGWLSSLRGGAPTPEPEEPSQP
ncbi:MAG: double zinc ribbon domain-containing protein, partial [Anaerolineales bacterium]